MSRIDKTEVLVVGAGPVGMLTAVLLAEEGIQVKIIDREYRTAAHSYACVLHPGSLELLHRIGLLEDVRALGRPIEKVAFYDGKSRRAEINFARLPGDFPYALVVPQSTFEDVLEQRLLTRSRTKVLWNHRLTDLQFGDTTVAASIDKLVQTAKGYIVPEWDWTVQKRLETTAAFVVGADGHDSMVRSRLGIEYECFSDADHFAVFEFETGADPGNEARVVMSEETTDVLWPLTGNRCRWTFQLATKADAGDFPTKDREAVRYVREQADERARRALERLARRRAPWFKGGINDIQWSARIHFEHRLVKQFTKGRGCLVGDAAHQTGPVGAQSMNAGLLEAVNLARTLKKILREDAPLRVLKDFNHVQRAHWEQLLGRNGTLAPMRSANPWVRQHAARILSCIPASGEILPQLIVRLGTEAEPAGTLQVNS